MVEGLTGLPAPGFYPQPNEYSCGPFALKHALLALGRMVEVNDITTTAKTNWWSGTDEIQLARAARAFDCDLVLERRSDEDAARKILVKHLREQTPVLLCVEEWSHWITVLREEGQRFVVVDSQDEPLLSVRTWPQLRKLWRYHDVDYVRDRPPVLYDLMAVTPRFRTIVKADFSVERVKFLRRPENRRLAHYWNEYLEDLREICRPATHRIAQPLSVGEFLRRHQELIVTRVVYWHGDVNRDEVLRVLRDLRFVSETYGLVIPASMSRRAVADLSILITLWACADRGINGMFGAHGSDPRPPPRIPPKVAAELAVRQAARELAKTPKVAKAAEIAAAKAAKKAARAAERAGSDRKAIRAAAKRARDATTFKAVNVLREAKAKTKSARAARTTKARTGRTVAARSAKTTRARSAAKRTSRSRRVTRDRPPARRRRRR